MISTLKRLRESMARLNNRRAVLDDELEEVNFLYNTVSDLLEAIKDGKVVIHP